MSVLKELKSNYSYHANREKIYRRLPEIQTIDELLIPLEKVGARVNILKWLPHKSKELPLYSIELGSDDPQKPCLLVVGGVHGLERIGTKVVNSMINSTVRLLLWDDFYKSHFEHFRLIFVPLLNPVGMYRLARSNGNNVDLMRNSPVDSLEKSQFLYGGHRISPKLPFYRGDGEELEPENKALYELVQKKVFPAQVSLALDVHSGFGAKDRLWFPFAKSKDPFPFLSETHALMRLLDETYQNHVYVIEPQAQQYTTHGDIWDYFLLDYMDNHHKEGKMFLPLTLEMGSWAWIKKNPLQILNPIGIFNPVLPHRRARMMRRHKNLFEFLRRAVLSHSSWVGLEQSEKELHLQLAMNRWYSK